MGFSVMLWGAEKLVSVEYWCPYGIYWNELEFDATLYESVKS